MNKIDNRQDAIWKHYQNCVNDVFLSSKPRSRYILRKMGSIKNKGAKRILNIGAGNGSFEKAALYEGWDVYSLDPDENTVNMLKNSGVKAICGRIEAMEFKEDYFDYVIATEVLEHLSNSQFNNGIREIKRVLKTGGWFMGTVPYNEDLALNTVYCPNCQTAFHRWGHERAFKCPSLKIELETSFRKVYLKRTAFVDLKGRNFLSAIKGVIRIFLAKYGSEIAAPSIFFMASKE